MKKHLKKAAQLIVSASVGYKSASFLFSKGVGEQEAVALGVGVAYLTNSFFEEGLPTLVEKAKQKKEEIIADDEDDDDFFDDNDCGLFEDEEDTEEPAAEAKEPEPVPEEKEEKPEPEAPKKGTTKKK